MKIIEALKQIKHLDRKIKKISERTTKWSSFIVDINLTEAEVVTFPQYTAENIKTMHQQITDWLFEKARLRHLIHRTNILTTVQYQNKEYTLDELIIRKTEVIVGLEQLEKLYNRKDKPYGAKDMRVVVQYDFKERDKQLDKLENEKEELSNLLDILTLETDVV